MSGRLLARPGPLAGFDVALGDAARIGSGADVDVRVDLSGILPLHATIARDGERMQLVDQSAGAGGGVSLNGRRVTREWLQHLDVITIGRDADFIYLAT